METNLQALVVDPEEARAQRIAAVCRSAGWRPELAADGDLALSAIDHLAGAPLLVTQLTVPRVDAFDVIARFRERFPIGSGGRVAALSSFPDLRATAGAHRSTLGIDLIAANHLSDELMTRALQRLGQVEGESAALPEALEASATAASSLEAERRELIHRSGIDRLPLRPPDPELQQFVQGVADRCGSPIALMTVALDEWLVFPARHGIDATQVDRYSSLCNKVIDAGEPLFVPDARANPAFCENGLVRAGVIRGYASAPVRLRGGPPIGTLCLIHSEQPLRLDISQVQKLRKAAVELGELLAAKT